MLRRIVVLALLALVVGLGVATASTQAAAIDDDDDPPPCVSSVECGGASVLVGAGLAMIVPAVLAGPPALAPVTRLVSRPPALRPRLVASRLYRPPRPS